MRQLSTSADVRNLVDTFYQKALDDNLIGHFFQTFLPMKLEDHLPIMYSFWESVLLDKMTYKGNPMLKHISLHQQSPIHEMHFDRWIQLWEQTVDTLFSGTKAELAKHRAQLMRHLMSHKIKASQDPGFIL